MIAPRLGLGLLVGALTLGEPSRAIAGLEPAAVESTERLARELPTPREVVFRLEPDRARGVDLLLPFRDASVERLGPMRLYLAGRWGEWHHAPWHRLAWTSAVPFAELEPPTALPPVDAYDELGWLDDEATGSLSLDDDLHAMAWSTPNEDLDDHARSTLLDALFGRSPLAHTDDIALRFDTTGASLASNGFGAIFRLPSLRPVRDWRCRRGPVLLTRQNGEGGRFELVRCDGSVAPDALDRLSILARPADAPSPGERLPDEPNAESWSARREWAPGVRVMHPRLLWALQSLADAFPKKGLVLYSGYRPGAHINDGRGHKSLHAEGRALDVAVRDVPNERVFAVCKSLRDVGCGFYPNNKFVHLHVRRAHTGKASWIDAAESGQAARYVDESSVAPRAAASADTP